MNERLAEAIDLFKENEAMFGDIKQDKEKANLYRGLAALAEGMAEIQAELKGHETAH
jgi:hypothetical protein